MDFEPTLELLPPILESKTGDPNKGLKVISTALKGRQTKLVRESLGGESYELRVLNEEKIAAVVGAQQRSGALHVQFTAGQFGEFVRQEVTINLQ